MADVFISYSSEDRDRVRPLAAALESRGLTVWWDRALAAGDDYAAVIQNALDNAKAVIVVWSRNSVDSPWVRDEAGRARDARRLVPVLFDPTPIPMGFGSINAEDFTAWNGAGHAPQVDLLHAALKARLEGKAPDGAALQAKRRRVNARIRLVSVLSVLAFTIAIVAGSLYILNKGWQKPAAPVIVASATPAPQQSDLGRLLEMVNSGKITGDQAVALSKLLQQQAFADVPAPASTAPGGSVSPEAEAAAAPADAAGKTSLAAASTSPGDQGEVVPVSAAELDQSAKATFSDAAAQLLQDPNPGVRAAALEASNPQTRKSGFDKLWAIAQQNGPSAGAIYRYCAAIGSLTDDPRTQTALERAREANPQDRRVWRMLSARYRKDNNLDAARGAALVGQGLADTAKGQGDDATQKLERALPLLKDAGTRAFVLGQLGDAAAKRDDWAAAEKRYRAAVDIHAEAKDVAGVAIDAPKLARAQSQQGEAVKACATLRRAQTLGVATVATQIDQTCQNVKAPLLLQRQRP